MANNKNSAKLSEFCFEMCETLKIAIQGRNADEFSKSMKVALAEIERCVHYLKSCLLPTSGDIRRVRDIERILSKKADAPRRGYPKERIDSNRVEIQQILHALTAPSSPHDESTISVVPVHSGGTATTSSAESGTSSVPQIPISCPPIHSFST